MKDFDINSFMEHDSEERCYEHDRLRQECIIANKVYDSVRSQDCLTPLEIGPSRAAEDTCIGEQYINEGEIIDPPNSVASVSVDKMKIKKIIIVDKKPSPFRNGYWDIDIKFVFSYRLTFREADGTKVGTVRANSIYNKRVTLFGSIGNDLTLSTDLIQEIGGQSSTINGEPYVLVEAKAVALSAELKYCRPKHNYGCDVPSPTPRRPMNDPNEVLVTIGLFSIIKIFRIVNLTVESRGFCVPPEGEDINPLNPCDFFDNLDFPLDVFAPPQKPEFMAGVTNNIPNTKKHHGGIEHHHHEHTHDKHHEHDECYDEDYCYTQKKKHR